MRRRSNLAPMPRFRRRGLLFDDSDDQVQGEARVEAQLARMAATVAVGVVRMVAVQRKENC
ncbi:hypothetical protein V6Z11_D10G001500 [Gossypium hirsutum]